SLSSTCGPQVRVHAPRVARGWTDGSPWRGRVAGRPHERLSRSTWSRDLRVSLSLLYPTPARAGVVSVDSSTAPARSLGGQRPLAQRAGHDSVADGPARLVARIAGAEAHAGLEIDLDALAVTAS